MHTRKVNCQKVCEAQVILKHCSFSRLLQFVFSPRRREPEKCRGETSDIAFALDKGAEGGDAVSHKVIGSPHHGQIEVGLAT